MSVLMLRRVSILGGLALLLALMWPVLKAGVASLYYFPAAYALEQWQKSTSKPEAGQLESAQQNIASALRFQPQNPHYQLVAAKIAEWAWFSGLLSTDAISKNEQIYQQAIALRPSWPTAYADYGYFLATVQFRLIDAWKQFELAERYGGNLPEVHDKILQVAFANWPALSVQQKAVIFARVTSALDGPLRDNTIRLIRQYHQQRQQCIYLRKKLAASAIWSDVRRKLCPSA